MASETEQELAPEDTPLEITALSHWFNRTAAMVPPSEARRVYIGRLVKFVEGKNSCVGRVTGMGAGIDAPDVTDGRKNHVYVEFEPEMPGRRKP